MQLSCEVCHSPLRAEDVRLDLAVAKCHACNAVYDLSGRPLAADVPLPPGSRLLDAEDPSRLYLLTEASPRRLVIEVWEPDLESQRGGSRPPPQ